MGGWRRWKLQSLASSTAPRLAAAAAAAAAMRWLRFQQGWIGWRPSKLGSTRPLPAASGLRSPTSCDRRRPRACWLSLPTPRPCPCAPRSTLLEAALSTSSQPRDAGEPDVAGGLRVFSAAAAAADEDTVRRLVLRVEAMEERLAEAERTRQTASLVEVRDGLRPCTKSHPAASTLFEKTLMATAYASAAPGCVRGAGRPAAAAGRPFGGDGGPSGRTGLRLAAPPSVTASCNSSCCCAAAVAAQLLWLRSCCCCAAAVVALLLLLRSCCCCAAAVATRGH